MLLHHLAMQDVFDAHFAVHVYSLLMRRLGSRSSLRYRAVGMPGVKDWVAYAGWCGGRRIMAVVHAGFHN